MTAEDLTDFLENAIDDSFDLGWTSRDAATLIVSRMNQEGLVLAPVHPAADLVAILHQYRSDMLRPPAPDSRERRVAMIDAAIAKFGGDA